MQLENEPTDLTENVVIFLEQLIESKDALSDVEREQLRRITLHVGTLLEAVTAKDSERVEFALDGLNNQFKDNIFKEVGKLTRKLHSSITDFHQELAPQLSHLASNEVPLAANQLENVIAITDKAAHSVLALVEKQDGLLKKQKDILDCLKKGNEPRAKAFCTLEDSKPLEELSLYNKQISSVSTEIILAQEFQDLSGQALKKVIKLIAEVQDGLVQILKVFGLNEPQKQPEECAAEVSPAAEPAASGCSQDDVDSLLGSFGF